MALAAWSSANGIPSAQPLDLVEHNGFLVLVLNVVEDDGSVLDTAALGLIVARLHQLPLPEVDFIAQNGMPINLRIVGRLEKRYAELGKNDLLPVLPGAAQLLHDLDDNLGSARLTHLDLRRQNVRVVGGQPQSIFDWSNALGAAPELEIARIEEYAAIDENGLDYEAFLEGYAREGGTVATDTPAWPILRLDTAVMPAVVFSSVAPIAQLKELFLARVKTLVKEL
ncbi:phosphotransferase [Paenarthrobacter sp. NPDC089989]|uniref:phosphotransferase n=1 Tax=unclassified Paenarthrobacter TaxID=2634190 RepID=UPI0037FD6932